VIDAERVAAIPEMLALGRVVNSATGPSGLSAHDQVLAGLTDCCRRLGVPLDRQTALAYALGVRHALDRFDDLLSDSDGDCGRELELYARVALLHDRADREGRR
jgi:hypothetical protein